MDKFPASHFEMESPDYQPKDFQGADPGDGVIYISSDASIECMSNASVDDFDSQSDDDTVALLALCVERQMELPTTTGSVSVPPSVNKQAIEQNRTPGSSFNPGPRFDAGYFDLGMGRGPIARDSRLRNDHLISIGRQLIPMVDTPMSTPLVYKYPTGDRRTVTEDPIKAG